MESLVSENLAEKVGAQGYDEKTWCVDIESF